MKFCKRYEEYLQVRRKKKLPGVGCTKLKQILEGCRRNLQSQHHQLIPSPPQQHQHRSCQVCDGSFFPSLLNEMSTVVGCFKKQASKLLRLHLASGFQKYFLRPRRNHGILMLEGKDLVTYAIINSIALKKILKKYDKIHYSDQGQAFRLQAQRMYIEILQSPWLCQLIAFCVNLRQSEADTKAVPELFADSSLVFNDGKPSLSSSLFDSVKIEIDLTCSICLDTVFDPVSLGCGHIFCNMCCCSAASLSIINGLKAADPKAKCPLCRQERVYEGAIHLNELNTLLSRSCPDYWEKRLKSERVERVNTGNPNAVLSWGFEELKQMSTERMDTPRLKQEMPISLTSLVIGRNLFLDPGLPLASSHSLWVSLSVGLVWFGCSV